MAYEGVSLCNVNHQISLQRPVSHFHCYPETFQRSKIYKCKTKSCKYPARSPPPACSNWGVSTKIPEKYNSSLPATNERQK